MPPRPTRRRFIASSSVATVSTLSAPMFVRALGTNDKLNLAVIGVANRGAANLAGVTHEEITALCDVDEANAAVARQKPHSSPTTASCSTRPGSSTRWWSAPRTTTTVCRP